MLSKPNSRASCLSLRLPFEPSIKALCLLLLLLFSGIELVNKQAHAQVSSSQEQAAEALLVAMGVEESISNMTDQILEMQAQISPSTVESAESLSAILSEYLSYEVVKPFYIEAYVDVFSTEELVDLTAFYRTPLGKKTITMMPELAAKLAQRTMQTMQQNMGEITQRMAEAQSAALNSDDSQ